ncbi:hypothetical protein C8Q77DRAFT_387356 [Trametes polyzona]|nr:hypothetical protein C8Q77DRAFT_387356 [Trametes polyzona]
MTTINRLPPDVLERICREVLSLENDGTRTLVSLASTSRLLHDPTLNVLWHTVPNVAVLFYTLPETIYRRRISRNVQRHPAGHDLKPFTLNGAEQQPEYMRFITYAQRIRVIRPKAHVSLVCPRPIATQPMYDILSTAVGSRILLPNLEAFHFKRKQFRELHVLGSFSFLFGPKLRSLHISIINTETTPDPKACGHEDALKHLVKMMQALADHSPQLEELHLDIRPVSVSLSSSTTDRAMHSLVRLCSLTSLMLYPELMPLTPDLFVLLARLPHLRSLAFSTGTDSSWDELASLLRTQDTLFPFLSYVEVAASTFTLFVRLLSFFGSAPLTGLKVVATSAIPRCSINELISEVARLPTRERLTQVVLEASSIVPDVVGPALSAGESGQTTPLRPIGAKTLRPLLALPSLRELVLDLCWPLNVDDNFLARCIRAWPKLCRLGLLPWRKHSPRPIPMPYLSGEWQHDDEDDLSGIRRSRPDLLPGIPTPRPTIFGLHALLTQCPYLIDIALEIDADIAAFAPWRQEVLRGSALPRTPYRRLRGLNVGLSPIEDAYAVAAFLTSALPLAVAVDSDWLQLTEGMEEGDPARRKAEDYYGKWATVVGTINLLNIIRAQERKARGEGLREIMYKDEIEEGLHDGFLTDPEDEYEEEYESDEGESGDFE